MRGVSYMEKLLDECWAVFPVSDSNKVWPFFYPQQIDDPMNPLKMLQAESNYGH